ncbi:MAG: SpoIIE family protein phosphatase [Gammaproteobacteria bacterium]|nr:SpoIIE family protein phosphatase [Gammaproteobacteria bacterium]MBU1439921.1 SpoIIE family protein phosphatase [Gammaproteobacteria bacterium]MBU2285495.1 SpoIIE family protein phosphatase [Gammaproteobacteria bacterium]MBU2408034.1 SpoIIE family protein phosphatase [Gammaproteobacteria bacterium]
MEVTRGWTHTAFPLDDASRIGEARRHAARLCADLGWDDVDGGRLAVVITELGTNLLRHATGGQMLIAFRAALQDVEVVCIDQGPGIPNVAHVMADGVSTGGGSPGTGLGAVQRLAASFEMHSTVPQGTVSVARVGRRANGGLPHGAAYAFGTICVPVRGESVCGDAWGVSLDGVKATVMMADGLGHGPLAAEASGAAIDGFVEESSVDLRDMVEEAHARLQSTRGAAICVLRIDADANTVRCAGAGNIAVRIVSGVSDRSMITQHGTAGVQIRKPDQSSLPLPPHALTIVHSDGLSTRWDPACIAPVLERDPTLAAAILFRNFSRGRDDATVVVVRQEAMA